MKRALLTGLIVLVFACAAEAQVYTTFTYTQTTATTGSGTISGFTYDDGGGPIVFSSAAMPAALVVNPGTGNFVGRQTIASGNSNEPNSAVGLVWSGTVTMTGTRGIDNFIIQLPLRFAPKVTQSPTDTSDYNWNLTFGDDAAGGTDVVSTASPRFAMWFSRDDVVDTLETSNTFQRYTQQNNAFVAGQDTITNNTTTTTAIKDAVDPAGAPTGTDAQGRDLAFYFGWRDAGTFSPQVILVDDFSVGGLLLVPEPGSLLALAGLAAVAAMRRRKV